MASNPSTKRAPIETTIGKGKHFPTSSVNLISRNVRSGTAGREINQHQTLGMDFTDVSIHVGMLNAGSGATVTGTATFSNLPSIVTGPNDTLKLHVHMTVDNPIGNLAISGFKITSQTQNLNGSNGIQASGPNFGGNLAVNVYQASISITVIAVNNAPAGNIICHCLAHLGIQVG